MPDELDAMDQEEINRSILENLRANNDALQRLAKRLDEQDAAPPQPQAGASDEDLVNALKAAQAKRAREEEEAKRQSAVDESRRWFDDAPEDTDPATLDLVKRGTDAVRSEVQHTVDPKFADLEGQVAALQQQRAEDAKALEAANERAAQTQQRAFRSGVEAAHPGFFDETLHSDEFKAFLGEMSPDAQVPYGALLDYAYKEGNADHASHLVRVFKDRSEGRPEVEQEGSPLDSIFNMGGSRSGVELPSRGGDRLPPGMAKASGAGEVDLSVEGLEAIVKRSREGRLSTAEREAVMAATARAMAEQLSA